MDIPSDLLVTVFADLFARLRSSLESFAPLVFSAFSFAEWHQGLNGKAKYFEYRLRF